MLVSHNLLPLFTSTWGFLLMNGFDLTACLELNLFLFLSRICLVGEKPDKELPGIVGARGDARCLILHDVRGLILFLPSHSSRVLSGDGLVGGNPTMNTPRPRRWGG